MAYSITIGELTTHYYPEDSYIQLGAKYQFDENAPKFLNEDKFCSQSSQKEPSYTAWYSFYDFFGFDMLNLFKNKDYGIMREHPGCFPITEKHLDFFNKVKEETLLKYPNAVASYPFENEMGQVDESFPEVNYQLARLEWLIYWFDYCLKNCEKPVIANS